MKSRFNRIAPPHMHLTYVNYAPRSNKLTLDEVDIWKEIGVLENRSVVPRQKGPSAWTGTHGARRDISPP